MTNAADEGRLIGTGSRNIGFHLHDAGSVLAPALQSASCTAISELVYHVYQRGHNRGNGLR